MTIKDKIWYHIYHPLRYATESARCRMEGRKRSEIISVLLVSDLAVYTSEQQFAALLSHRDHLRRRLGIVLNHKFVKDVLDAPSRKLKGYHVIIVKLAFWTGETSAFDIVTQLRRKCGSAKFIYFDGDDDVCISWGRLLEKVDLYVKKQIFARRADYQRQFVGKSNLTDYVARIHAVSFEDNIIPKSGIVEPRYLHKVALGYSVATDDRIIRLFRDERVRPSRKKDIDIVCRAASQPESWIHPLRATVIEALSGLTDRYRLLLPDKRVTHTQYNDEMRRSRICISPFGYGEVCWRDFEAIIFGCLLVKPDMSHLRTEPDIFIPGETYVPVKWDFSDLAETCSRYLVDDSALNRITRRAYDVLANYYESHGLVDCFQRLLARIDIELRSVVRRDRQGLL